MRHTAIRTPALLAALVPASVLLLGARGATTTQGTSSGHEQHQAHDQGDQEPSLVEQLAELRASVARLEAALDRNHQATTPASPGMGAPHGSESMSGSGKSMSGMTNMGSMGAGMKMGGMGQMGGSSMQGGGSMGSDASGAAPRASGMQMGMGGAATKRMQMMGRMGGMGSSGPVATLSRLPGFPGASHIYHIGATGFFLDYAAMIELSVDQRKSLAEIQEQSALAQSSFDRRIDQAEQELWVLTSAGEPDAKSVEAKVRAIAGLEAEQRLAFIHSVGKAAQVLSDAQRRALVGDFGASPPAEGGSDPVHDH